MHRDGGHPHLARGLVRAVCHRVVVGVDDIDVAMDLQGILGIDDAVRNGFSGITVRYQIDAEASEEDIAALVAQSQKRSAVFDIITNPTNVNVLVNS